MSYLTEVLADAPDHYWRLADPGGFLEHDIGSSPFTGVTPIETLPYTGPVSDGGAMAMPSLGGVRTLQGIFLSSPRTLECWYYPIISPASVFICAFDATVNEWGLSTDANTFVAMSVGNANLISSTAVTREHWHHIVGTFDGTNARLYMDALLVAGPTTMTAGANVARQIFWGSSPVPANIAYGAFAECATYPSALSAARVTAHFLSADQRSSSPVFRGGAISTGGGTGSTSLVADLSAVLAAVQKTFPTT